MIYEQNEQKEFILVIFRKLTYILDGPNLKKKSSTW